MKNILVCDDDKMTLEVTRIILSEKGYKVFTLENCDLLLEKVKKIQPHLILMDLMIEPIGGAASIKLLKNNAKTKDIPILLFSAILEIEKIAAEIDADAYISKPFEVTEFENIIDSFCVAP